MAITPSNWGRRVEITEVATTAISETGYVGLLTEANMPTEIWSLAENGGGDLRVCLNSDGTNQLPLEVVEFDTAGQTAVLWFRFPTFVSGESVWLFYDKAGEVQPAITDPFGRNAVWQDADVIFPFNDPTLGSAVDVTGNSQPASVPTGGAVTVQQAGQFGDCYGFDGSQVTTNPSVSGVTFWNDAFSSVTYKAWIYIDSDWAAGQFFVIEEGAGNGFQLQILSDLRVQIESNQSASDRVTSTAALSTNQWNLIVGTMNSGSGAVYINGAQDGSGVIATVSSHSNPPSMLDSPFKGRAEYLGRYSFALSPDYISTEYANQSSPATFWSTGTPENTTGGGGLTIQPTAIASAESVPDPVVTNLLQIVEANAIPTQESVPNPELTLLLKTISANSIPTAEAFNNPVVVLGATVLLPNAIPSEEAFGTAVLQNLLQEILPTGIASAEDFGTPTVLGGDSIVIPVTNRQTVQRIAEYLKGLGFTGNNNDIIMAWLRSEGYNDAYNDNFSLYLEEVEGLTGSFTDKFGNWRKQ